MKLVTVVFVADTTASLIATVSALLLAGCAVGPNYRTPEVAAPVAWHSAMKGGLTSASPEAAQLARWWNGLGDPHLSRFIE